MFKAIFDFVNRFSVVLTTLGVTGLAIGMGVASAGEYNPITNCYDDPSGVAPPVCYGDNRQPQAATPKIGYDPCYLKQNAMRPCERPSPTPVGVDRSAQTDAIPFMRKVPEVRQRIAAPSRHPRATTFSIRRHRRGRTMERIK
jgi:hypothetical protein